MKHRIAIIASRFNEEIVARLLEGALRSLQSHGISKKNIEVHMVAGAFEIPLMAKILIKQKKYDGIIALGCVLKGETDHYKAVCDGVTYGIQKVMLDTGIPIMFGVLMCKKASQAMARSKNDKTNKGYECAEGLIEFLK